MPTDETSDVLEVAGVKGRNTAGGFGVFGEGDKGHGVAGQCHGDAFGVYGNSDIGTGVVGESPTSNGVLGQAHGDAHGVLGLSDKGTGVGGDSKLGHGVVGQAHGGDAFGVFGLSDQNTGVVGESKTGHGVVGQAHGAEAFGIFGRGGKFAGFFEGDVHVTGIIRSKDVHCPGADVAEQFDVVGDLAAEPGCVVVLAGDDRICVSREAYDRKVAGVVSGAGSYRPALVLDHREDVTRRALALSGKVWCKVDAGFGAIAVGDMLTTSPTPGHAMHAADPVRAFGAVIGKALGSLKSGRGLLPILVALQ